MDFNEYQEYAEKTAIYPGQNGEVGMMYCTLGLAGEAGEVANKIKKVVRDHGGIISDRMRADIQGELGDVLWYMAQLSTELGIPLNAVASFNQEKLKNRATAHKLQGDGDGR